VRFFAGGAALSITVTICVCGGLVGGSGSDPLIVNARC
jgi:hypothetical protein